MPCGIASFVGLSDRNLLSRMLAVQRHRCPDSIGYYLDQGVGLGTDRQSIIDLPKGDQPIHNEDSTVWITYNGEIYNYMELKAQLEADGHRFYTECDTETIVHAYEKWGAFCLQYLRGMFAFALWDANHRKLLIARDRFGKKSVYYTLQNGALLRSLELKGILKYEGLEKNLDYEALGYFFAYSYIPSPFTPFREVRKLPPGHYLTYDGRSLEIHRY